MKNGMTHSERHMRRSMYGDDGSPSSVFMSYIRDGAKVSKWKLFIWSMNGLIPIMDDEQLREQFGDKAFAVLVSGSDTTEPVKKKKEAKRKVPLLKRKKRRLMPSDYAWLLRESGKKYETVPDPSEFYRNPRSGRKGVSSEEREQVKQQRLQEWWDLHNREIGLMKAKAAKRRARKKLRHFRESIYNRREQEALSRKTLVTVAADEGPRTAFVRVKPELYKVIVCGECPVFCWTEVPGKEDMFQPNMFGPVKRVAVRPPGQSMRTPWAEFEVEWLRRIYRETGSSGQWVWEVGLGRRIEED